MILGATLLASLSLALPQEATPSLQVRAREIHTADGRRLENAVVTVRDGKIAAVGSEVDAELPLLEHDGVLTAGLVGARSFAGLGGEADDGTRSILPSARLVHAVDRAHPDFGRALEEGITTVLLTTGGTNVVGGHTVVMKTTGEVLQADAHLAVSFADKALGRSQPRLFGFFGADGAARDGGLENTAATGRGARFPTSYSELVRWLRARMGDSEGVFARVRRGELPLLIEAWDRHEVQRAVAFAREFELRGAIHGAPLAGDPTLVKALTGSGLGVVVGPYGAGQERRSLEAPKALAAAGIPFAFALDTPGASPLSLRMSAALALGAGAEAAPLRRALTLDAARLAGVDARVGSLEVGKDADLVLWSGDPLDLTSRVEAVFVDGVRVHRAAHDSKD